MNVSIIIPAYNEEKRIENTLLNYSNYFEKLRKKDILDYEILVVINNTKDRTEEIVRKCMKNNSRIIYINLKRGGKGYAVIEGFKDALKRKNELIGFVDADMSTRPEHFYELVKNIGNCGGIIASRYIKGAIVNPKPTIQRILASRIFNFLIRAVLMINYRDTQCGAKLFGRKAIEKILPKITMSQWAFDVDLLYNLKKAGIKIKEFPTVWSDKNYSKINFMQAGPWMALGVLRLRFINSPFNFLVSFYDKTIRMIKK